MRKGLRKQKLVPSVRRQGDDQQVPLPNSVAAMFHPLCQQTESTAMRMSF